jgi:HSP90 family molecular chaperone
MWEHRPFNSTDHALICLMQGEVEFRSILFVPATKKEDITDRKTKNIRLYVKRVFISDDFDGELVCSNSYIVFFTKKYKTK